MEAADSSKMFLLTFQPKWLDITGDCILSTDVVLVFLLLEVCAFVFSHNDCCHLSFSVRWLQYPFLLTNLEEQVHFLSWVCIHSAPGNTPLLCKCITLFSLPSFFNLIKTYTNFTTISIILDGHCNSIFFVVFRIICILLCFVFICILPSLHHSLILCVF